MILQQAFEKQERRLVWIWRPITVSMWAICRSVLSRHGSGRRRMFLPLLAPMLSKTYHTRLMVLCPFVFLQMRLDTEPLTLQPTEVHSAHWVSLRALTSPYLSNYIRSDVSGRFGRSDSDFIRPIARLLFGQVLIKGIDLVPTESVYCSSGADLLPSGPRASTFISSVLPFLSSTKPSWEKPSQQLILWGLTLGTRSMPLVADPLANDFQVSCQTSSEYSLLVIHQNYGRGQPYLTLITSSQSGFSHMHTASRSCRKSSPAIREATRKLEERRDLENLTILRLRLSKLDQGRRSRIALCSRCLAVTMIEQGRLLSSRCCLGLALEACSLPGVCVRGESIVLRSRNIIRSQS